MILRLLRNSPEGLYVVVVGAARDLAEAITREPALFEERCRGIYLNIGSGSPDPSAVRGLEWNVKLDPAGYAQIFRAPCPIYWMPCLQDENGAGDPHSREFATHYRFRAEEILKDLPAGLRNYFGWMFSRDSSSTWLEALRGNFEELLASKAAEYRKMYSTASFFDLAGYGVTRDGLLLPKSQPDADWVYRFEPVEVDCSENGETRWSFANSATNRFLFRVLDPARYPAAMVSAMRELLLGAYRAPSPDSGEPLRRRLASV